MTSIGRDEGAKRDPFWVASMITTLLTFATLWYLTPLGPMLSWIAASSATALALYAIDKGASLANKRRVPESLLLLLPLLGGFSGSLAGMFLFRHKIRKRSFWTVNLFAALMWCVLLLWAFLGRRDLY
ncbi:MAG: DUF1294 domain-containing protein [Candidatus Thermoplasmatota archaeon]|nr:DUF1294 domain-containing protein [Candidatus Thermoplasmatota archaeon]